MRAWPQVHGLFASLYAFLIFLARYNCKLLFLWWLVLYEIEFGGCQGLKVEDHNGMTKDHSVVAKNQHNAIFVVIIMKVWVLDGNESQYFMLGDWFWVNIDEDTLVDDKDQ